MTKKDYVLIAGAITEARTALMYATVNAGETKRCIDTVAEILRVKLGRENTRFDDKRFATACGVEC